MAVVCTFKHVHSAIHSMMKIINDVLFWEFVEHSHGKYFPRCTSHYFFIAFICPCLGTPIFFVCSVCHSVFLSTMQHRQLVSVCCSLLLWRPEDTQSAPPTPISPTSPVRSDSVVENDATYHEKEENVSHTSL